MPFRSVTCQLAPFRVAHSLCVQLPQDAEVDKMTANFKDGVLTVSVGRTQPTEPEVQP